MSRHTFAHLVPILLIPLFVAAVAEAHETDREEARPASTRPVTGTKRVELDIRPDGPSGSFVGSLRPAMHAAGWNWSTDFLWGYLGMSFIFSMKEDGGSLWHEEEYEWYYFWPMLHYIDVEVIDVVVDSTSDNRAVRKALAWGAARDAIDAGLTPIVWNAFPAAMKEAKMPRPSMWSLIIGYDEVSGTYTVHHSEYGKYTIRWDAFGQKWFCVMIAHPLDGPFEDALTAHRTRIQRSVRASKGELPANKSEATAHGLAAWEMWLDGFQKQTISIPHIKHHAGFLEASRRRGVVYLKEILPHFPENARVPLREAANEYEAATNDLRSLIYLSDREGAFDLKEGAEILSRALEHERAGVAKLQEVLDATQPNEAKED